MRNKSCIVESGEVNKHFKNWLECNFGFYTSGVLIDSSWDSNVVYQYDPELDALKSSYNNISMKDIFSYEMENLDDVLYLRFYAEDKVPWCSYEMMWLNETAPKYFWDNLDLIKS